MKILILTLLLCLSINVSANTTQQNSNDEKVPLRITELTIEDYDIDFSPEIFEYSLTVPSDLYTLKVKPKAIVGGSIINLSDNLFNLRIGENITTLTIEDKQGNSTTYTINVTKIEQASDNNLLADLKIENYKLNFDPKTREYELEIKNESELKIEVSPESILSKYEITGNSNLKNNSKIVIKVTAKNGDINEYTIKIKKPTTTADYIPMIIVIITSILGITGVIIFTKKKNKRKPKEDNILSNSNKKDQKEETEIFHL